MKHTPVTSQIAFKPNLTVRVNLSGDARIGPGKIALLEQIAISGSISGGGRALRMSYRRAWQLIEEMNLSLGVIVVETAAGGSGGGGSSLTDAGREIVKQYRLLEKEALNAAQSHIEALMFLCKPR